MAAMKKSRPKRGRPKKRGPYAPHRDAKGLLQVFALRLTPAELERLQRMATTVSPATLARRALTLGLDAIERDPGLLNPIPPANAVELPR